MINLDSITNKHNKECNGEWQYIPDHPYRIMIIGSSGSEKINALINLINEQNNIGKMYLYAKDLSEPKYEFLIEKGENVGIKHLNNPSTLSSVQIRWMTFMKILMITIQSEKE